MISLFSEPGHNKIPNKKQKKVNYVVGGTYCFFNEREIKEKRKLMTLIVRKRWIC